MITSNNRQRYRQALEKDFAYFKGGNQDLTRLEFLSDHIFGVVTYDSEMAEFFAQKAIEVCLAISNQTTFKYTEELDNYKWFLVMMNMPFFDGKLSCRVSLRDAWWEGPTDQGINLWTRHQYPSLRPASSSALIKELSEMEDDCNIGLDFTVKQWHDFIEALAEFAMNT
jgi:hypothetical protein